MYQIKKSKPLKFIIFCAILITLLLHCPLVKIEFKYYDIYTPNLSCLLKSMWICSNYVMSDKEYNTKYVL